jgi:hypothetical protein
MAVWIYWCELYTSWKDYKDTFGGMNIFYNIYICNSSLALSIGIPTNVVWNIPSKSISTVYYTEDM